MLVCPKVLRFFRIKHKSHKLPKHPPTTKVVPVEFFLDQNSKGFHKFSIFANFFFGSGRQVHLEIQRFYPRISRMAIILCWLGLGLRYFIYFNRSWLWMNCHDDLSWWLVMMNLVYLMMFPDDLKSSWYISSPPKASQMYLVPVEKLKRTNWRSKYNKKVNNAKKLQAKFSCEISGTLSCPTVPSDKRSRLATGLRSAKFLSPHDTLHLASILRGSHAKSVFVSRRWSLTSSDASHSLKIPFKEGTSIATSNKKANKSLLVVATLEPKQKGNDP